MSAKNIYLTTTLPYVNADPHIGFALEVVQADSYARYQRLLGNNVFFNTGTDEHGQKIYQKAVTENKDPKEYVDEHAKRFDQLKPALNLSYNSFIRTTDTHHITAAQKFWKLCDKNGDIYKKKYKIKYCVGCELEKTDSELENLKCPLHPNREIEIREEENYFFRFSKYQGALLDLYEKNPDFVIPDFRLREILTFVKDGLTDFSISRLKEKMPWGIEVPGDRKHVMYVWFDALINYVSALDWPDDKQKFQKLWPGVQFAGKDNLRQQSAMWQAMLMSAKIAPSKQIVIHGFITSEGQKMSKSLGNVIDPFEISKKYTTDALRYYLLAKITPFEDSDFTLEKFENAYQGELANGLGNLVSRIVGLSANMVFNFKASKNPSFSPEIKNATENYEFDKALSFIWEDVSMQDKLINENKVWTLDDDSKKNILINLFKSIEQISYNLRPFLPETSDKIFDAISSGKKEFKPLFPRLDK